jgi:hypothetical protein
MTWCIMKSRHASICKGEGREANFGFYSAGNLNVQLKMRLQILAVVKISCGFVSYGGAR